MKVPCSYSRLQIVLHWLSAAVILWALVTGSLLSVVDVDDEFKSSVASFNVSLTSLFIPLFILRAWLAFLPSLGDRTFAASTSQRLARIAHCAIYVLTAVVLLTGVLMMKERADVFGLVRFGPVLTQPELHEWFTRLHIGSCIALAALLALHIAAVINHQMRGNPVLKRMWFQR
jgi:cytochrome b561